MPEPEAPAAEAPAHRLRIDIITIFPELLRAFLEYGIPRKAIEAGALEVHAHDLREWAGNKFRHVDDYPYGGGGGMDAGRHHRRERRAAVAQIGAAARCATRDARAGATPRVRLPGALRFEVVVGPPGGPPA